VWWAGQGLLGYFGWPLLLSNSLKELHEVTGLYTDRGYALVMGAFLLLIMAAQAVMVFPVPRPREKREAGAGFAHFICAGGVVSAAIAAAYVLAAWGAVTYFPGKWRTDAVQDDWPIVFLVGAEWPLCALWLWSRYRRGVPAAVSALIAGTAAALLVASSLIALTVAWDLVVKPAPGPENRILGHAMCWTVIVSWGAATLLVARFLKRSDRETAMARLSARLFLGTVVEAGAIIPLDVMVRRKNDCYCFSPTLWGLTVCLAVGSMALGPVVWLVPLGKRRRRWRGHCESCGYDMSGLKDAARCPECGAGWRVTARESDVISGAAPEPLRDQ
jgi:hypothetical protein